MTTLIKASFKSQKFKQTNSNGFRVVTHSILNLTVTRIMKFKGQDNSNVHELTIGVIRYRRYQ